MFSTNMHPYTCLNSIAVTSSFINCGHFFFQTNTTSRKALIIEEWSVLMSLTKCGVHLVDFLKIIGLEFVLVSLQVRFLCPLRRIYVLQNHPH